MYVLSSFYLRQFSVCRWREKVTATSVTDDGSTVYVFFCSDNKKDAPGNYIYIKKAGICVYLSLITWSHVPDQNDQTPSISWLGKVGYPCAVHCWANKVVVVELGLNQSWRMRYIKIQITLFCPTLWHFFF